MPEIRGIRCWLQDVHAGTQFAEYNTTTKNEYQATTWVASEEGKQFSIEYVFPPNEDIFCRELVIGSKKIMNMAEEEDLEMNHCRFVGAATSEFSYAPFKFTFKQPREFTESNSTLARSIRNNRIVLRLWRCRVSSLVNPRRISTPPKSHKPAAIGKLGKSHGIRDDVGYGDEVTHQILPEFLVGKEDLIDTESPYAEFVFNFRTNEFLKAEGIIPESLPNDISSQPTITRQKRSHSLIEEEEEEDLDNFLEERSRKNRARIDTLIEDIQSRWETRPRKVKNEEIMDLNVKDRVDTVTAEIWRESLDES